MDAMKIKAQIQLPDSGATQHITTATTWLWIQNGYIIATVNLSRESCRDWTSSSIGPVLYIPCYCTPRHPLSIMSFISRISDDTVNFEEIAVLFKYLSPKEVFLCPRYNNQDVTSYQYSIFGLTYRLWVGLFWTVWEILQWCIEDVDERTCRQTSDNMASRRNS